MSIAAAGSDGFRHGVRGDLRSAPLDERSDGRRVERPELDRRGMPARGQLAHQAVDGVGATHRVPRPHRGEDEHAGAGAASRQHIQRVQRRVVRPVQVLQ